MPFLNPDLAEKMRLQGYLPAAEAARLYGVALSTLAKSCRAGRIRLRREGSCRFVHRLDLAGLYPTVARENGEWPADEPTDPPRRQP